jgi:cell division initiation protein
MKITPVDLAHKTFNKKMFGLDEAEVTDFLSQIATQMEELILERNNLREKVREKDIALADLREKDQVLKSTIATASQMSDRLRQDTEREAKLILADAQQKAEMITRDARESLKKTYQEISDLKKIRLQFEANLKALTQAHLSLLEQGEKFMPQIGLNNLTLEKTTEKSTEISPLSIG